MDYRTSRLLVWLTFLGGFLLLLLGDNLEKMNITGYTAVMIIATGLIQGLIWYRCPHCHKSLMSVSGKIPKKCPFCGGKLEKEH